MGAVTAFASSSTSSGLLLLPKSRALFWELIWTSPFAIQMNCWLPSSGHRTVDSPLHMKCHFSLVGWSFPLSPLAVLLVRRAAKYSKNWPFYSIIKEFISLYFECTISCTQNIWCQVIVFPLILLHSNFLEKYEWYNTEKQGKRGRNNRIE